MKHIQLGTFSVMHSDWLPYATGCLISYCNQYAEIQTAYEFASPWFKYRPISEYQLSFDDIDILGLTCYVWNQTYNDKLSKAFKSYKPNGIVIYGGPNVPNDQQFAQEFADKRAWVDLHFVGPGEKNIANWLISNNLEGTFSTKHFMVGDVRKYQINSVPTPYTDGVFDSIVAKTRKIKASFETNRGCPYACAFCDWGGQAQSKLTVFDCTAVQAQIDWIYQHKNINEIEILDANFGIIKQDIDTIKFMIGAQQRHQHQPFVSYSGLAKNGSKWLPNILDLIFAELPIRQRNLKISFQTHDTNTLDIIQRHNIDNTKLYPLIASYKSKNIPTTSELIIALPGETAESWLRSLDHNHRLGIDYIRTYFLNLVSNTPMYSHEYKTKHNIKTKTLRFPYEFSSLGYDALHADINKTCLSIGDQEEIEIIYHNHSYDLDELLLMFDYHWFYHNLINSDGIRSLVKDVYSETKAFCSALSHMPTLASIINKNRDIIKEIFKPEAVTNINDLGSYLYFSRCLRTDDVYQLWNNRNIIVDELSLLYDKNDLVQCVQTWRKDFSYNLYGTDANLR